MTARSVCTQPQRDTLQTPAAYPASSNSVIVLEALEEKGADQKPNTQRFRDRLQEPAVFAGYADQPISEPNSS
jgi:hypothetical protein